MNECDVFGKMHVRNNPSEEDKAKYSQFLGFKGNSKCIRIIFLSISVNAIDGQQLFRK